MKPDTRSFYEAMVQGAIERIAGHLDEAIDLEALARQAGLSPYHFHRIFRGMKSLRTARTAGRACRADRHAGRGDGGAVLR